MLVPHILSCKRPSHTAPLTEALAEEMNDMSDLLAPLRKAIYPICFDTGYEENPFNTFGTCFLIELECGVYAVTLKHVLKDMHVSDIFIFEEGSQIELIRFKRRVYVECVNSPDSEIKDLALLEIDPQTLSKPVPCYNLSKISNEWELEPENYHYAVFGYPSVNRDIDQQSKHIQTVQYCLNGVYAGKSMLEDCYKLQINESNLNESGGMDGFSGSPVFAWHKDSKSVYEAVLCGVAIQAKGSTLNFLRRREIDEVAREICS